MIMLEQEHQRDANWDKDRIKFFAKKLNLAHSKVYKWTWDRRKKETLGLSSRGQKRYEEMTAYRDLWVF